MSLGRPYFVPPTYWEDPLPTSQQPALPPDSLRRLHFSRIAAVPQTPASRPARPMPVQAAPPPAPAAAAPPRKRSRIRAILAPLAITVIVGTAFGGVMLSSLGSRNASVGPPAAVPSSAPTRTQSI